MPLSLLNRLLDLVYPPRCALCGEILAPGGPDWFCGACLAGLQYIEEPTCAKCGGALENENGVCALCRGRDYVFARNVSLFEYGGDVRNAIHRFKFNNCPWAGAGFGALMAEVFQREFAGKIDFLTPVPMHKSKRRRRGFNQAAILAGQVSKLIGVPLAAGLIVRRRDTAPQSALNPEERQRNMLDAFGPGRDAGAAKGAAVLLVDDIFTTGSTVNACAQVLITHGVKEVHVMTLSNANGRN